MKLAEEGTVLAGRRVNLGPKYSARLRAGEMSAQTLEKSYLWRLPLIIKDCEESHSEAGISLDSNGYIFNRFVKHKSPSIVGCNYSCFRDAMIELNGYDESYGQTSLADDTDLEWRFRSAGFKVKSCKYAANMFHLFHGRSHRDIDSTKETEIMLVRKEDKLYRCEAGLSTH
ncbi:MAG: galactosyltransferase-related protein [Motiliproteus sp.]